MTDTNHELAQAVARLQRACQRLDRVVAETERTVDLAMAKYADNCIDDKRVRELMHDSGCDDEG